MGADMLIESIGLKAKNHCLIDEEWAATAFAQARRAIDAIDESRLANVNSDTGCAYDDIESYKQDLIKDLAEIEVAVVGAHRQAAMVEGGEGVILLVSGGLSWGDSPGKLFDSMSRLTASGVFPDVRWAKETRHRRNITNAHSRRQPTTGGAVF